MFKMSLKLGIGMRKVNKKRKIKLIDTYRPSIPPSCVHSFKICPWNKSKEILPADSYFSTFIIGDDLNIGDMSCGNWYTNNHTLSQQGCDSNNGDASSGYGFFNSPTLSQCEYSNTFKDMDGDAEKVCVYVSSGCGF